MDGTSVDLDEGVRAALCPKILLSFCKEGSWLNQALQSGFRFRLPDPCDPSDNNRAKAPSQGQG